MSDFQQRLWTELVRDHAAALAYPAAAGDRLGPLAIVEPRAVKTRQWGALRQGRLVAGLAAVAAALVIAAIAITTGTAPSAAYAVTQSNDGTVHVSISDLTGITGANEQLEKLGVPVRVVPVSATCTATGDIITPPPSLGTAAAQADLGIAVRPDLIPSGDTLVLTAKQAGPAVYLSYAFYRGPAPACVAAR